MNEDQIKEFEEAVAGVPSEQFAPVSAGRPSIAHRLEQNLKGVNCNSSCTDRCHTCQKPPLTACEKFHAHLDECEQCEQHPFNLCETGARLLQESANAKFDQKQLT